MLQNHSTIFFALTPKSNMMWFRSSLLVALLCALALANPVPDAVTVTPVAAGSDVTVPAVSVTVATPTISASASASVNIGGVNVQVTGDLWAELQAQPDLSDFVQLIKDAGLEHYFKDPNVKRTVFAPINAALRALRAKFDLDQAVLKALVKSLVIAGKWTKEELMQAAKDLKQQAIDAANQAQQGLSNVGANVQNAVNQVVGNAANQVQNAINQGQTAANAAVSQAQQTATQATNVVNQIATQVSQTVQNLIASINQKLLALGRTLSTLFTTLTGKLANAHAYVDDLFVQGGKIIQANIDCTNGMIHKIDNVLAHLPETIANKLATSNALLLNKIRTAYPELYNKLTDPSSKLTFILPNAADLADILASTGNDLRTKLNNLVFQGVHTFEDLKQSLSLINFAGLPVQITQQSSTSIVVGGRTITFNANVLYSNGMIQEAA